MNRTLKSVLAIVFAVAMMGLASQASALSVADALGSIVPGHPAGDDSEVLYVNALLDLGLGGFTIVTVNGTDNLITRSNDVTCSGGICEDAVEEGLFKSPDDPSANDIDVTGFTYLLAKYDGEKGGSLVWDITGLTEVDIPSLFGDCGNPENPSGCGLSHYTLMNPGDTPSVPEPGTLVLLGSAMVGLGFWSRKRA